VKSGNPIARLPGLKPIGSLIGGEMAKPKDAKNLRKRLEEEFLIQLSKHYPGFLTEEEWNRQRKRSNEISGRKLKYPPDRQTEIKDMWFDLDGIGSVLKKACEGNIQIGDGTLMRQIEPFLAFKSNPLSLPPDDLIMYPGHNSNRNTIDRYDRREYREALIKAARNALRNLEEENTVFLGITKEKKKAFSKLPPQDMNLDERYFVGLSERQREVISLKL